MSGCGPPPWQGEDFCDLPDLEREEERYARLHKSPPLSKGLLCWDRSPGSGYNPQRLNPMALSPGSRLGPYQVTALIGSGGMGEVWRARDTKLHRDVALKVLPDVFADDPERLARFLHALTPCA